MSNTDVFLLTFFPALVIGIVFGFTCGSAWCWKMVEMNREFAKEREMEDWEP